MWDGKTKFHASGAVNKIIGNLSANCSQMLLVGNARESGLRTATQLQAISPKRLQIESLRSGCSI